MPGKRAKRVFALDVPGIHVFAVPTQGRRGWPGQARPRRKIELNAPGAVELSEPRCGHLSRTDAMAAAQSLLDLDRLNTVASQSLGFRANRLN
jgi:hypothetical protein